MRACPTPAIFGGWKAKSLAALKWPRFTRAVRRVHIPILSFRPEPERKRLLHVVIPTGPERKGLLHLCHSDRSRSECDGVGRNLLARCEASLSYESPRMPHPPLTTPNSAPYPVTCPRNNLRIFASPTTLPNSSAALPCSGSPG